MVLPHDAATLLKTGKQVDSLVITLLGFLEIGQLEGRMLMHRTRKLVMRQGEIECSEKTRERMTVAVFVVRMEELITGFDALVVLFVEEKAL